MFPAVYIYRAWFSEGLQHISFSLVYVLKTPNSEALDMSKANSHAVPFLSVVLTSHCSVDWVSVNRNNAMRFEKGAGL